LTKTVAACGPLDSLLSSARAALDAKLLPVAVELLSAGVAGRLSIPNDERYPSLLIRYAGTPETVAYQTVQTMKILREVSESTQRATLDEDDGCWGGLAALPVQGDSNLIWRAQFLPSALNEFLTRALRDEGPALPSSSLWHAGLADGRLRVMSSVYEPTAATIAGLENFRALAQRLNGGRLVIEHAPQEIRESFDAWGDFGSKTALMRRVKDALDPNHLFSPGRFVKGL
jgi:glycolate oxidase FAD binding subunit